MSFPDGPTVAEPPSRTGDGPVRAEHACVPGADPRLVASAGGIR